MANQDYYGILGVTRNASGDEIRQAYRKMAVANHPDKLNSLPVDERTRREENMYQANKAYGVLSDVRKRTRYDSLGQAGFQQEGSRQAAYQNYETFFNDIFGEFGSRGPFGMDTGEFFGDQPKQLLKAPDKIKLPVNDWGLISALVKAYRSKSDGCWEVKISPEDKRLWMDKEIYLVDRKAGKVRVYRSIKDWREPKNREETIRFFTNDKPSETAETAKSGDYLSEYYLIGEGVNRILDESRVIPGYYPQYLRALKSLAQKISQQEKCFSGGIIAGELHTINNCFAYPDIHCRIEGTKTFLDDSDKEWVRKTPIENLSKKIMEANGLVVQTEGQIKSKEGQLQQSQGEHKG